MNKSQLQTVKRTLLGFSFEDFLKITAKAENVVVSENGLATVGIKDLGVKTLGETACELFTCLDKFYFVNEKGVLFLCTSTGAVRIFDFCLEKPKICIPLEIAGEKVTLFTSETHSVMVDKDGFSKRVNVPCGESVAVYAGRLMVASGNTLTCSALLDYLNFSSNSVTFNVEKDSGNIIALVPFSDKLYLICQYCLYELNAYGDGEDYTLKKVLDCDKNKPINSVVKTFDGKITAIMGEKLYHYSNGKFVILKSILDNGKYLITGKVISDKTNVYIPVKTSDGKDALYCRFFDEIESVLTFDNHAVFGAGIVLYEENIFAIVKDGSAKNYYWESLPLYFDSNDRKAILKSSMEVEGETKMRIKGDSCDLKLCMKNGFNLKKTNAESRAFTVSFSGEGQTSIKNVKFNYVKKGG